MSARKIGRAALWMRAPMLLWALAFVGATLGYVLVISFLTRDSEGYGVVTQFTLDNYRRLLNPNYLQVFWQSVKLAFHTTAYLFIDRVSVRLSDGARERFLALHSHAAGDCAVLEPTRWCASMAGKFC